MCAFITHGSADGDTGSHIQTGCHKEPFHCSRSRTDRYRHCHHIRQGKTSQREKSGLTIDAKAKRWRKRVELLATVLASGDIGAQRGAGHQGKRYGLWYQVVVRRFSPQHGAHRNSSWFLWGLLVSGKSDFHLACRFILVVPRRTIKVGQPLL